MSRKSGRLVSHGNVIAFGLGVAFGLLVWPRISTAFSALLPSSGSSTSTTTAGLGWRPRHRFYRGGGGQGGGQIAQGGAVPFTSAPSDTSSSDMVLDNSPDFDEFAD